MMLGLRGPMKVFMSYWELIWKSVRGAAWLLQLSLLGKKNKQKKTPGFHEVPGKNKPDFIRESTSHRVLMWQLEVAVRRELTDTQKSPVIPETCGSCKNNSLPPHEPLPLSSHAAQSTGSERCVFSWGCPPWVRCEWGCVLECVCTSNTGAAHYFGVKVHTTTASGIDLDGT